MSRQVRSHDFGLASRPLTPSPLGERAKVRSGVRGRRSNVPLSLSRAPLTLSLAGERGPEGLAKLWCLVVCLLLVLTATPALADGHVIAWVGGTVHPVSGPPIEGGVVVAVDGVITQVGAGVEPPEGATVVDVSGRHLYPGYIHPLSVLGLIEIETVAGTVDTAEMGDQNAALRAEVAFNTDSLLLPETMANGVLSAHIAMQGGVWRGTSAVMRLHGWTWEDATVAAPSGLHLDFPTVDGGDGEDEDEDDAGGEGAGGDEALEALDRVLDRARHYAKAKAAGSVDENSTLEAFLPLLDGALPLHVHADSKAQIEAALDWAERQQIGRMVLFTGSDARYVAARLATAGVDVVLLGIWRLPPRDWEPYDVAFTTPEVLLDAGVRFAIGDTASSFEAANARNLPYHAAQAAAFGLTPEQALRSITLSTAEILGVADHLGSLEPGKDATLFVADGDPLEIRTHVERVWVRGHEVDLESRHQYRLYEKYRNRPAPPGPRVEEESGAPEGRHGHICHLISPNHAMTNLTVSNELHVVAYELLRGADRLYFPVSTP